jgi:hypothetical protein
MMTKMSQPGAEPANVFEDRDTAGQWRVEWFDDDGRCELEIFTGHDARRQAPLRYAMRRSATPCGSTGISEKYRERSRARYRACPSQKLAKPAPLSAVAGSFSPALRSVRMGSVAASGRVSASDRDALIFRLVWLVIAPASAAVILSVRRRGRVLVVAHIRAHHRRWNCDRLVLRAASMSARIGDLGTLFCPPSPGDVER